MLIRRSRCDLCETWHCGALNRCAVTGTHVTPVLGFVPTEMAPSAVLPPGTHTTFDLMEPSVCEVEEVFTLPVAHLLDEANITVDKLDHPIRGVAKIPRYSGGPADVWGLTAFMLQGVLSEVLAPAFGVEAPDMALDGAIHAV